MELLENKIVKVGDREFPIRVTNRAMIEYEKLAGSSISDMDGHERLIKFFYCTARAGAKSEGKEFNFSFEQFLDAIDNYYLETLTNFSKAIAGPGGEEKKPIEPQI